MPSTIKKNPHQPVQKTTKAHSAISNIPKKLSEPIKSKQAKSK